jgi:hypothetical protein
MSQQMSSDLSIEQYLSERVDDQINWFNRRSGWNQQRYKYFRIASTALAVSIPFLTGLIGVGDELVLKITIGLIGALVAVIEGIQSTYKFHENWIQYRTTAETLLNHKFMFQCAAGPYADDDAFHRFVENVEGILAAENNSWANYIKKKPEKSDQKESVK